MRVPEPISVLPYLRRPTAVETSKETLRKVINLKEGLKLTCGAGCPVGRDVGGRSYAARTMGRGMRDWVRVRRVDGDPQEWLQHLGAIDEHGPDPVGPFSGRRRGRAGRNGGGPRWARACGAHG